MKDSKDKLLIKANKNLQVLLMIPDKAIFKLVKDALIDYQMTKQYRVMNEAEALSKLSLSPIGLIIAEEGHDLVKKCKEDQRLRKIPFVLISQNAEKQREKEVQSVLLADVCIERPINIYPLEEVILDILKGKRSTYQVESFQEEIDFTNGIKCYKRSRSHPAGQEIDIHYMALKKDDCVLVYIYAANGVIITSDMEEVPLQNFKAEFSPCQTHQCSLSQPQKSQEEMTSHEHYEKGNYHFALGEYDGAIKEYTYSVAKDSDNVSAHYALAKGYDKQGMDDKASESYLRLLQRQDIYQADNVDMLNQLGMDFRRKGMYDQSALNYLKAIKIAPDNESLFYNLSVALLLKKEYGKAHMAAKRALQLAPDFEEARDVLAKIQPHLSKA